MRTRVLLVDDEAMVRVGLRLVLESEPDIEVVGEAADGNESVAATSRLHPDVVLMDIRMPRLDGLSATRQILATQPGVKVVVLTTFNEDAYVREALRAGASGFLLRVAPGTVGGRRSGRGSFERRKNAEGPPPGQEAALRCGWS